MAERCSAPEYAEALGQATSCVEGFEQGYAAQDPEASSRREAAESIATKLKEAPDFRSRITEWSAAYDRKKIQCRYAKQSQADRNECDRHQGYVRDVEAKLTRFLEGHGLDPRDFRVLGLWPSGSAHDR